CKERGCMETFNIFERRLTSESSEIYGVNKKIAEELGISVDEVENHYRKALRWYKYLLREEIAAYVEKRSEIEEEIRDLWNFLG
ncbi:MAG: hypothetical protein N2234_09740, partial [Planctomycetota bacterium]|nr:hypothetical protein [Planctomycetota bacterium]